MVKTPGKLGIELNFHKLIKNIYRKLTANTTLNGEKLETFPTKIKTRQRFSLSPLLFHILLEVLVNAIRQEKEIEGIQIRKEMSLLWMTRSSMQKLLELISGYSKVTGYKVKIQKSIVSLYTSNDQVELGIWNTMLFTLAPKKYKILRYKSNKICMRSIWGKLQNSEELIEEELNKWRDTPCSWTILNIVKISVFPNLIYRFKAISIKIQASYFVDINKLILKFMW